MARTTPFLESGRPVRRHSLLKRNPGLSRAQFSEHYEFHHGPLAARQAGFRKYTVRYIQNHVLDWPGGSDPLFDGCTQTTQVRRDDYRTSFFSEPDYANVTDDEQYLFDISKTVSVLGVEEIWRAGAVTTFKALLLTHEAGLDAAAFPDASRIVMNRLDVSTASALGFGQGRFDRDALIELWFDTEAARDQAVRSMPTVPNAPILLPVRELLIFGPEKPWTAV